MTARKKNTVTNPFISIGVTQSPGTMPMTQAQYRKWLASFPPYVAPVAAPPEENDGPVDPVASNEFHDEE